MLCLFYSCTVYSFENQSHKVTLTASTSDWLLIFPQLILTGKILEITSQRELLHCPLQEIQVTSPEQRHSSHRSSATHSCQCAQYFPVLKQGCDCQCLGFLGVHRCWCMRLHTEAVRTPSESLHWKLTLGEKSLAAPGTRTRVSIVPGLLVRSLYPLSYLRPFSWVVKGKRRQIGIVGPVSKNGTNTQQVAVF